MFAAGNFLSEVTGHTITNISNIIPSIEEDNEAWKTFQMMEQLREDLRKYVDSDDPLSQYAFLVRTTQYVEILQNMFNWPKHGFLVWADMLREFEFFHMDTHNPYFDCSLRQVFRFESIILKFLIYRDVKLNFLKWNRHFVYINECDDILNEFKKIKWWNRHGDNASLIPLNYSAGCRLFDVNYDSEAKLHMTSRRKIVVLQVSNHPFWWNDNYHYILFCSQADLTDHTNDVEGGTIKEWSTVKSIADFTEKKNGYFPCPHNKSCEHYKLEFHYNSGLEDRRYGRTRIRYSGQPIVNSFSGREDKIKLGSHGCLSWYSWRATLDDNDTQQYQIRS